MVVYRLIFRYHGNSFWLDLYSVSPVPCGGQKLECCDEEAKEIYRDWRVKNPGRSDLRLFRLLPWQETSPLHGVIIAANEA